MLRNNNLYAILWLLLTLLIGACSKKSLDSAPSVSKAKDTLVQLKYSKNLKSEKIDAYFNDLVTNSMFNGNILVIDSGMVIYQNSHGMSNFEKGESLTMSSSFEIASVSKQFTAAAILRLRDKGLLSLSDSVQKFFPQFPYPNISIRLLLLHRSGLPNYNYFCEEYTDRITTLSNLEVMNIIEKNQPATYYPPDTKFNYSNTGYVVLASIVENVSGKSFADFMHDEFFAPLGMKHTFVNVYGTTIHDSLTPTTGHHFNSTEAERSYQDGAVGDKGIYSSVIDLALWDEAIRNGIAISHKSSVEAFAGGNNEMKNNRNYGYGWRIRTINNQKIVYHGGWWRGHNSLFVRLPYRNSCIIILANKRNKQFMRSYFDLLSILDPITFPPKTMSISDEPIFAIRF